MLNCFLCNYLSQFFPGLSIQKLKLGDVYICSLNNYLRKSNNIFTSISCGACYSWKTSIIKAQSEYVERKASRLSGAKSTTGFAAFPFIFFKERAKKKARKYAYFEMVERYAWPEWFYNNNIHYQLRNEVNKINRSFYQGIHNELNLLNLYVIYPKLEGDDLKMVIIYALTESGLACGGAVRQNEKQAEQNALKELYMHAVGLYRMKNSNLQATTNYEKRVAWIGKQHQLLKKRLTIFGNQGICIPFPIIFRDVKTVFHRNYVVQRCLFKGYNKEFISKYNEMYV